MKALLLAFFVLLGLAAPAAADEAKALKGVALVVGQSKYQHVTALPNPDNDANAIAKLLTDLGFEVTLVTDRDAKKLRRDLDRFGEDADGADVAVIYYSGHGIEAGGENWLVPVDADPAALGNISKSLVPLTPVLDDLKSRVGVSIVLIDACRSNPFPPGTLAKQDGAALAMAAGGLGAPRGFAPAGGDANETLGTVIGFAAEPGQPALDGAAGENSPYAAAILRHLAALPGTEFGLVMRMITEEVYLKTKTQQRPWVNESLRKELYFGAPPVTEPGEAGVITKERRKLLLTISDLPMAERQRVERVAREGGVPLDTLYGVLAAMGVSEVPKDPQALDAALKTQAGKIKSMLAEQTALSTDDPGIKRLSEAADRALNDGAIKTARGFLDQAKARVEASRGAVEDAAAKLKAKRIANAAILFKSAEAAELDFDYYAAARDYNGAFDWVKIEDKRLAAKYLTRQADALQSYGEQKGDNEALKTAIGIYQSIYKEVPPEGQREQWAKVQNNLGNTYLRLGERGTGTGELTAAIGFYRLALDKGFAAGDTVSRAVTGANLGIALHTLGQRRNDPALYAEARQAFQSAIAATGKAKDPLSWAQDVLNLANLDLDLAQMSKDAAGLAAVIAEIEEALKLVDRGTAPVIWAQGKMNLGIAYRLQGAAAHDPEPVRTAIKADEDALSFFDRQTFPMDWATANGNLAIALTNLGALTGDVSSIESSLDHFRDALQEITAARAPAFWARLQASYGLALQATGFMKKDNKLIADAADAFRAALTVRTRETNAAGWAETQSLLASALSAMASEKGDPGLADQAIAAYHAALEVYTRSRFPDQWRSAASGLAAALQGRGIYEKGDASIKEAAGILQQVLDATSRGTTPLDWASVMKDAATIQFMLGTRHMNKAEVEQSLKSFDAALEVYDKLGSSMDRMMIHAMRDNAAKALDLFK